MCSSLFFFLYIREENVRLHSKPGTVEKVPERKKHIVAVKKWIWELAYASSRNRKKVKGIKIAIIYGGWNLNPRIAFCTLL